MTLTAGGSSPRIPDPIRKRSHLGSVVKVLDANFFESIKKITQSIDIADQARHFPKMRSYSTRTLGGALLEGGCSSATCQFICYVVRSLGKEMP